MNDAYANLCSCASGIVCPKHRKAGDFIVSGQDMNMFLQFLERIGLKIDICSLVDEPAQTQPLVTNLVTNTESNQLFVEDPKMTRMLLRRRRPRELFRQPIRKADLIKVVKQELRKKKPELEPGTCLLADNDPLTIIAWAERKESFDEGNLSPQPDLQQRMVIYPPSSKDGCYSIPLALSRFNVEQAKVFGLTVTPLPQAFRA